MAEAAGSLLEFEERPGYPHKVLKVGVWPCDEAMLNQQFVLDFPVSVHRPIVYAGFIKLRRQISAISDIGVTQWVDGSFVEAKVEPNDVDLVSFADLAALLALEDEGLESLDRLLSDRGRTKEMFHCDSFLIPVYPVGHPLRRAYLKSRRDWRKFWGTTRADTGAYGKGFLEMTVGENPPAILELEEGDLR